MLRPLQRVFFLSSSSFATIGAGGFLLSPFPFSSSSSLSCQRMLDEAPLIVTVIAEPPWRKAKRIFLPPPPAGVGTLFFSLACTHVSYERDVVSFPLFPQEEENCLLQASYGDILFLSDRDRLFLSTQYLVYWGQNQHLCPVMNNFWSSADVSLCVCVWGIPSWS